MTLHVPRLPFSLDPLMAEAKRRALRRRLLLALSVAAAAAVAAAFAVHSGAGPGGAWSAKSDARRVRQSPVPRRVSIQVMHQSPLGSMVMGVNNVWRGQIGRRWVLAYAGMWNKTSSGNTSAGAYEPAVMLFWGNLHLIGVYPARGSETSVKITAANGNLLRLIGVGPGARGQTFQFNLATRAYSR
jgi:hypothetical protein